MTANLTSELRQESDCAVELTWKTEPGEKRFEACRAVNLSEIAPRSSVRK